MHHHRAGSRAAVRASRPGYGATSRSGACSSGPTVTDGRVYPLFEHGFGPGLDPTSPPPASAVGIRAAGRRSGHAALRASPPVRQERRAIDALAGLGFGHIEIGTVTAQPQPGNPKPRLFGCRRQRRRQPDGLQQRRRRSRRGAARGACRRRLVLGVNVGKTEVVPEDDVAAVLADYGRSTRSPRAARRLPRRQRELAEHAGLRTLQAVERLQPAARSRTSGRSDRAADPGAAAGEGRPDLVDDDAVAVADLVLEMGSRLIATNTTISREGLRSHPRDGRGRGGRALGSAAHGPGHRGGAAAARAGRTRPHADRGRRHHHGRGRPRRLAAGADLLQGYTAFMYERPGWPRRLRHPRRPPREPRGDFGNFQNELYFGAIGVACRRTRSCSPTWRPPPSRRCRRSCVLRRRRQRQRVHPADQRHRVRPVGADAADAARPRPSGTLSVELFGMRLPTPLMLAPIGRDRSGHPGRARRPPRPEASAATGVPMIASTLIVDPLEDVAAALGDTPACSSSTRRTNRDLAASFVKRAERRLQGASSSRSTPGCRAGARATCATGNFPQLRGKAWPTTSPTRSSGELTRRPRRIRGTRCCTWVGDLRQPADLGRPALAALAHRSPAGAQGDLPPRRRAPGDRRGRRRHLLLQPRRPPGQRRRRGDRLLPGVVDAAAASDAPVIFDSGVRRGADVVKALALGATAVGIGRPYAYGLAIGGVPRRRARAALVARRGRPDHGGRRLPDARRPDARRRRRLRVP